jgi:hypothetical protein
MSQLRSSNGESRFPQNPIDMPRLTPFKSLIHCHQRQSRNDNKLRSCEMSIAICKPGFLVSCVAAAWHFQVLRESHYSITWMHMRSSATVQSHLGSEQRYSSVCYFISAFPIEVVQLDLMGPTVSRHYFCLPNSIVHFTLKEK